MTLPNERTNSIEMTRQFLYSLLDPKQTPRIPRSIRQEARWCLKHFPHQYEIEYVIKKCPTIFGKSDFENK